jgi:hypothetical protein
MIYLYWHWHLRNRYVLLHARMRVCGAYLISFELQIKRKLGSLSRHDGLAEKRLRRNLGPDVLGKRELRITRICHCIGSHASYLFLQLFKMLMETFRWPC